MKRDLLRKFILYRIGTENMGYDEAKTMVYFLNKLFPELHFKFSLISGGLRSRNWKQFLAEMLEQDYIDIDNGIYLTEYGYSVLKDVYCDSQYIADSLNKVFTLFSKKSYEVIIVAGIADMVMTEKTNKFGVDGISNKKEEVMQIVKNFNPVVFDENTFNEAILLINELGV